MAKRRTRITRTLIVKLRKWFPPNDPLAASVARLCILREDFLLECRGVQPKEIEGLDQHSDKWRRIYFHRNMARTLMEIRSAIVNLQKAPEFAQLLGKQPKPKQDEFRRLFKVFNQSHEVVKEIRDSVGGHVLQKSVEEALDQMDFDREGFYEIGQTLEDTHYKFASELVIAVLLRGVPEELQEAKIHTDFDTIASLIPVLSLIHEIFEMYARERRLLV